MLSFRKKLISKSQDNLRTEGRKDQRTEGQKDQRTVRPEFIGPPEKQNIKENNATGIKKQL